MSLFKALKPMLPLKGTILITLAAVDGDADKMRVTITPVLHEDDRDDDDKRGQLLNRPVVVTATVDELEVDLADHLTRYLEKRATMREEFESLDKELEQAKKDTAAAVAEEKKRAAKGVPTLPTPATPPVAPKPEPKKPAALF